MKRAISVLLCAVLCLCFFSIGVSAVETQTVLISRSVETLENGEYIVTELYQTQRAFQPLTEGREVQGNKTKNVYMPNGTLLWSLTVEGTFNCISGISSKATTSYAWVDIHSNNVKLLSKSASCSGNTATATGTVSYNSVNRTETVSISCDIHGNLY